jgi:hypothetical protein
MTYFHMYKRKSLVFNSSFVASSSWAALTGAEVPLGLQQALLSFWLQRLTTEAEITAPLRKSQYHQNIVVLLFSLYRHKRTDVDSPESHHNEHDHLSRKLLLCLHHHKRNQISCTKSHLSQHDLLSQQHFHFQLVLLILLLLMNMDLLHFQHVFLF